MKKSKWSLNKTEVRLLQTLQGRHLTLSELASELSKSANRVSETVNHLETMGLVRKERKGSHKFVFIPKTPFGESLSVLITEEPMLNLEALFSGSGLLVLPLLLKPGYSAKKLAERTSLSMRTVKGLLPRWKRMGVVLQEKTNYYLNPRFKLLADFLRKYNEHKNLSIMKDRYPEAVIVWQWRDEFMLSTETKLKDPDVLPAGLTRLDALKDNLVHTQEYYYYGHADKEITEEEAFMQALYVDPYNPRIKRLISERLRELDSEVFFAYAGKYAKKTAIKELVNK
ncbi:MAG: helix-turn-helix transcriptional regulator [Thermoplasmata archaeon]|nr:helix-turn-helix transcriptional regulator [Thermoplasmata archaeon]